MKKALAISVLFFLLAGNFQTGLIWLNYSLQKNKITELFCINKSKPTLKCEGKCHIKKQIKEDKEKEGIPTIELRFTDPCIIDIFSIGHQLLASDNIAFSFLLNTDHESYPSGVFHPPQPVV